MSDPEIRDWRGTPITPGQTVVYGGPVGRSIQQVEGVVDGFTKSGRVRVRVVRRSYTVGTKDVVDVGADRVTVVEALPPTTAPTQADEAAEQRECMRVRQTHDMPPYYNPTGPPWTNPNRVCTRCGVAPLASFETECAS